MRIPLFLNLMNRFIKYHFGIKRGVYNEEIVGVAVYFGLYLAVGDLFRKY